MKRFYCTVCQRIKRVRRYPKHIENQDNVNVTARHGVCNYHEDAWHRQADNRMLTLAGRKVR